MAETKKKRQLIPNVRVGNSAVDADGLRALAQRNPTTFMAHAQDLIDSGELRWDRVRNIAAIFRALFDVKVKAYFDVAGQQYAIDSSAFPILAGGMTIAGINAGYDAVPTIGEQLVTEVEDNKKVSVYVGLTSQDTTIDRVDEGQDFPEIGAGEEKFEIRSKRNGRRISVTMEAVEENDIAGIEQKINALVEISGEFIEEQTLRRVCDIDGSGTSPAEPYVLRPNGAGAALYQTAATTLTRLHASGNRVTNNPLVDTTSLDAARTRLMGMYNTRGKRMSIDINQCILLVPDALRGTAQTLQLSELQPGSVNEYNPWGTRGANRPRLLSSPKLDDLSTTVWYLGNFQKQFKRKWKLRWEYVTLGTNTESYLTSRLAFQARVAWDVEIGATDYVYVVQNLSAETAP